VDPIFQFLFQFGRLSVVQIWSQIMQIQYVATNRKWESVQVGLLAYTTTMYWE